MRLAEMDSDRIPNHIAVIMDGNGRWAEARGLERNAGHRAGLENVREIVRAAGDLGLKYLTLYAFSSENWERPKGEVGELMHLLEHFLEEDLDEAVEQGVRIRAVGRLDRLPPTTREAVDRAMEATSRNTHRHLILALSYGARAEIVDAARSLMRAAERGELDPEQLDEKSFASHLYLPDVPDPDLMIRTGGEYRVSNFLLWQIAYSELYSAPVMWPDFHRADFEEAILEYAGRERRFGRTGAQTRSGSGSPNEDGASGE